MRQLVAILFTDMVGYSRQMGEDEPAALRRLERHNALLHEVVHRHEGRVVKTVGDSFVVTFQSSVSAVECALDAQRGLELQNSLAEESERFQVRMGIHAGDVVVRDGDVFGDAVNIAARLEAQAPPGGVCISRMVFEQIRRKVHARVEALGGVALKNISEPMTLFVLRPGDDLVGENTGWVPEPSAAASRSRRIRSTVTAVAALAAVAGLLYGGFASGFRLPGRRHGAIPRRGGVLRIAFGESGDDFNIYSRALTRASFALTLVVEPLIKVTHDSDHDPESVVEKVDLDPTGTSLVLHVRRDAVFQDHRCFPEGRGRAATAADVTFSIEQAARNQGIDLPIVGLDEFLGERAPSISGIKATAPDRVTIATTEPAPFYEAVLENVPLVPSVFGGGCESLTHMSRPSGTGPFQFASDTGRDGVIVLEAAPKFRGKGPGGRLPYLDKIEIREAANPTVVLTQVDTGRVDLVIAQKDDWPEMFDLSADAPRMADRYRKLDVGVATDASRNMAGLRELFITAKNGPLRDRLVLQAVARGFDRAEIIATSTAFVAPAGRFLPRRVHGFNPSVKEIGENLGEARALLAKAGHAGGDGLAELVLGGAEGPDFKGATVAAAQLGRIGVRAHVETIALSEADSVLKGGRFDAVFLTTWMDIHAGEIPALGSDIDMNDSSARIVALSREVSSTLDPARRTPIYARLEAALMEDLPAIPIAWVNEHRPNHLYVVRNDVQGFYDPATQYADYGDLKEIWLDR